MNDYKELIEQLNGACIVKVVMKDMTKADLFARAADAIEQLLAENEKLKKIADSTYNGAKTRIAKLEDMNNGLLADREILRTENAKLKAELDAAVADLSLIVHDMDNTCICDYCIGCEKDGHYAPCATDDGDRWEWRGVQND